MNVVIKEAEARRILLACYGRRGVWADPSRYANQCWTRDFSLAILPALLMEGDTAMARIHLDNLSRRVRSDGRVPILFLDRILPFLWDKVRRSISSGKLSFMLRRWLQGELWNLTPGTRDSELHYLLAMHRLAEQAEDRSLLRRYSFQMMLAKLYLDHHLLGGELLIGCDWRDTMEKELGGKPLLSNNALLYELRLMLGRTGQAEKLEAEVRQTLHRDGHFLDYPESDRFDPLGGALAVLSGLAKPEDYPALLDDFRSVDTGYGVTIRCRHNPISVEEAVVIERTDGVVVWPFVVGYAVLALLKMGEVEFARGQFEKLTGLEGFREWYDPATGQGYGAQEQLWSAALFLRAADAMR